MNFHDILLPNFINIFILARPEFITSCVITKSRRESRSLDIREPFHKYILKDCRLSKEEFYQFKSFFNARAGRRYSFRLKDYADYQVNRQFIAKGNGKKKQFNLYKLYEDPITPFIRNITKPSVDSVQLYKNNLRKIIADVDYITGQIYLAEILTSDETLYASFEFDVCVRFNQDNFEYKYLHDGSILLADIELVEVYQ